MSKDEFSNTSVLEKIDETEDSLQNQKFQNQSKFYLYLSSIKSLV